ncbi:MAG: sensor histidine kinase, partial [Chloroflexi bacterium]|nr:sensor histidine kinase [Chloroflexota bacterium]
LLGNAVKYTPVDAGIRVRLRREAQGITICVDDEGPGISIDLRDGIFEPFRRGTDLGVPGTGIGLSLVDNFSRMHGGRAWVEERPGGGCRFQVYLPAPRHGAGVEVRDATCREGAGPVAGEPTLADVLRD